MANRHFIEITRNRENIRLIYLDISQPTFEIQSKLLELNPAAQFYTDIRLCTNLIKSIMNEDIFLIISNILLTDILDSIYSLRSILAIFIYDDKQEISELKSNYPKIIDIYTNPNDLFQSIEEKIQFIEKQIFIYSLLNPKENLTKESASFICHQMLINTLKQIPQKESIRDDILNRCLEYYQTNRYELDKIELFRRNYTDQQAIQWYTDECFLYKLLNRALCTEDMEFLYSFRFFIIDLCLEIEREYENIKNQGDLIVYRGQIMSNEEIEKFKQNIGCLISTNGFLLTTRDRNRSLSLFKQHFSSKENVLLEIHVDLSIETIILADISSYEQEILFNINSLFKIDTTEYDSINHIWEIKLIASKDETNHVNEYLKRIQQEMDYHSSLIYFGHLLWNNLGQINQAKYYFEILLKSLPNDHIDISEIYVELGNIYDELGEHNLALQNHQYALDIRQKQIPKDFILIASSLNNIGIVYKHMGNLAQAIDYCRQSLEIYETKCSKNKKYFHRANTITNLALAYRDKNDFDTALKYFTLAYNIRRDSLPNDHSLLANSLSNIGNIYHDKNDFNQALDYYQQALSIQDMHCPNDDLNKANIIRNIGLVYRDQKNWQNALNYFNHVLEIRQRLLPNINHSDIAICYGDIGHIYEKMNNLDSALDNYHRQFQIEEQSLPPNHSNLMIHFDSIINILKKKDQSKQAIELCQMRLLALKDTLGNDDYENNPCIARILILMATIYEDENPKEADQHYQQVLLMLENKKNEQILLTCLSPMTNFYWKCRMFDRALICQMKLLNLRRSTLSSNHNDIAYALQGLARLYRAMNKYNEALHYFHQSLNILQANYGSEHIDVKNIQQEIFDLKDTIHSLTATANEDYGLRRLSSIHKQLITIPQDSMKSPSFLSNDDIKTKPSRPILKSALCIII
jgi:tetratricopeptide (TPR) repeat protein